MKEARRIILRTQTFERISLRKNSKINNRCTLRGGLYRLAVSVADGDGGRIIFEAESFGAVEIEETSNEIRLVCRKKI